MNNTKVYGVYDFEDGEGYHEETLVAICSSEEKAKWHILNMITKDMIQLGDDGLNRHHWVYDLFKPPTKDDFKEATIIVTRFEDEDEGNYISGYYYSEWEVL